MASSLLMLRLCGRPLTSLSPAAGALSKLQQPSSLAATVGLRAMASMKAMTPEQHKIAKEDFWKKNERLERPMSPHLTIYKFQLPANMSVTHRATGITQVGCVYLAGLVTFFSPISYPELLAQVSAMNFGGLLILGAKFLLAWPTCYHLLNGVRHLAWDLGYGFKMTDLYKTGWAVLGLSLVMAGIIANL